MGGTKILCEALSNSNPPETWPPVQLLGLRACDLGDEAAVAVADLIRKSPPKLIEVRIDENHIGDAGAEAVAEAIRGNSVLKILCIGVNSITESGKAKLTAAMPEQ